MLERGGAAFRDALQNSRPKESLTECPDCECVCLCLCTCV
jgi:hypothetical protein